ncbi:MAG: WD40 repeat domain-containing protein, partial [Promethearchaeota archaeon]
ICVIFLLGVGCFYPISPTVSIFDNKPDKNNTLNTTKLKSSAIPVLSLQNYTLDNTIANVEISEDGNYIVASTSYTISLFNKSSSKSMWNFTMADSIAVMDLAISANGTYIAVGSEDGVALFNNTYSINKLPMWNYSLGDYGYSVEISLDGFYIAVGTWNSHKIFLFNNTYSASKTPMWSYTTQNTVDSVAISADGTYIAAGGKDSTVYFLNKTYSTSKTEMWKFNTTNDIKSIDISVDGRYIAVAHSGSSGGNISYFDTTQKTRLWKYDHFSGYAVHSVDMSADGKYLVSWGDLGFKSVATTAGLFDNSIQTPKKSLWSVISNGYVPKISADGYYAIVGYSNNVTLYDRSSSTDKDYTWSYEMGGMAYDLAISANGSHVAASSSDNKVYLLYWDVPEHPKPRLLTSNGDGDKHDEVPAEIPFGNFYLLIITLTVFCLIVIIRRKIIFKIK